MVQLPREYKDTTPAWLPLVLGGVFGSVGFFALCYGIGAVLLGAEFQSKRVPLGLGAGFLFMGITFLILHWNYVRHTINCTPAGFSVLSESKRGGARREEYRWEEITGTSYEEIRRRNSRRRRTDEYFSVDTKRGRAFKVDDNQGGFDELIALFNDQTPQLPYVWIAEDGSFATTMLRAVTRAARYNKAQRPSQTVPPPLPPPLPPPI